jgi:hypothetical protein
VDELEQIDEFAAEQGYTRSDFLLRAAKTAINAAKTKGAKTKGERSEAEEAERRSRRG